MQGKCSPPCTVTVWNSAACLVTWARAQEFSLPPGQSLLSMTWAGQDLPQPRSKPGSNSPFWILPFLFGPAHICLLLCVLLSFPVEMIQPRSRGQQLLVLVSRMNHPTPCLVHSQSSLVLPSPHGGWNLRRPNVLLG